MTFTDDDILVTGGAGFIGSNLVDKLLLEGANVTVLDNLVSGNLSNLKDHKNLKFQKMDLREIRTLPDIIKNFKIVFHVAAYPEVRTGFDSPQLAYTENIENTFFLLEAIRKSNVEKLVFTSSSVVYGEPDIIPTPETYGPLLPISNYGGSKLACEALISSYCHTYGFKGTILRFANVIGSRSRHGVIWDFINKILKNKTSLEVLGNGKQNKSYIHVKDCIDAMLFCTQNKQNLVDIFNIGNDDTVDVITIAKIVCATMNFDESKIILSGGTSDGRGWIGDIMKMNLDTSKLKKLGWNTNHSSLNAVKITCNELFQEVNSV